MIENYFVLLIEKGMKFTSSLFVTTVLLLVTLQMTFSFFIQPWYQNKLITVKRKSRQLQYGASHRIFVSTSANLELWSLKLARSDEIVGRPLEITQDKDKYMLQFSQVSSSSEKDCLEKLFR